MWLPYMGFPVPPEDVQESATHMVLLDGTEGKAPRGGTAGRGLTCDPWGLDGSLFSDPTRAQPSGDLAAESPFLLDMFAAKLWSPAVTVNHANDAEANALLVTVDSRVFAPE